VLAEAAGTYTMDARFAGDAEYWPSSDQVDFEVIVQIDVDIDIKPGGDPNAINLGSNGVLPDRRQSASPPSDRSHPCRGDIAWHEEDRLPPQKGQKAWWNA
jgi:hypothetical protein